MELRTEIVQRVETARTEVKAAKEFQREHPGTYRQAMGRYEAYHALLTWYDEYVDATLQAEFNDEEARRCGTIAEQNERENR